jgi:glycosyltransferase involved in cell wall biosynthesis
MRKRIESDAPSNVEFVGRVGDAQLADLYRRCRALIYPQHEDFGLIAVEAQAAGRPVIGYGRGGLLDTVRPLPTETAFEAGHSFDATGVYFTDQQPEAIRNAIEEFEKLEHRFEPLALRRWAERFSPARFDEALDVEIAAALATAQGPASKARPETQTTDMPQAEDAPPQVLAQ